jgi:TM2 domain-containing membrane protein YozV
MVGEGQILPRGRLHENAVVIVHYRRNYGGIKVRYNVGVAYLLWLISGFGCLGFHRFYLGKVGTGILWIMTGGLFGIGCIYDAVTLGKQVRHANIEAQVRDQIAYESARGLPPYGGGAAPQPEKPEKTILRVARKNGGFVSPGEVALDGDISVDQAKKILEKMAASGNAEMRVRSSGVVVYFFPEFAAEGRDDFAL